MDVECRRLDGSIIRIPQESLIFRPAAYAIIADDGRILLLQMMHTGKYHLPGGGIRIEETIPAALRRETREETGIEIQVGDLAHFEELFFYYDPSGRAYHGFHFYYRCTPLTTNLLADGQVVDGSAGHPRWVEFNRLQASDFQTAGEIILRLAGNTAA